jgi:hypothetical protein
MIGEVIAVLGLIVDYIDEHPEIAKKLASEVRKLLSGKQSSVNVEAMRGLAAGMAAARANAVQAYVRKKAAK